MKTQAAVLCALNQPLEIMDLEIPKLAKGQVLVEIAYSGICRTQLNEIKGYKGHDPYLPHTLGHEGSGIVLEIGPDVSKVNVGDHVVLTWIKGSGIDAGGCKYISQNGVVNSGAISTFMNYSIISENRLVPIPNNLPLREAALLGCAIPTGAGIVFNQLKLSKGSSCAVFGTGGIGLSAILAARFLGANPIIAIDISDTKLEQAVVLGATHIINAILSNVTEKIQEYTRGKGVEGVIESAGHNEAMEMAYQSTALRGTCILAGNLPKGQKIQIDPFGLILGKTVKGSWGGESRIDEDIAQYVPMLIDSKLKLDKLITHEIHLNDINNLLEDLQDAKVGRGIIAFC